MVQLSVSRGSWYPYAGITQSGFLHNFLTSIVWNVVRIHDSLIIIAGTCRQLHWIASVKSNQIFHYTRWITPKRVTSLRDPSPRHCDQATQLLSKKCRSGGEPLATLCLIWPARDVNLRPPAPETNALPLDQLAGWIASVKMKIRR